MKLIRDIQNNNLSRYLIPAIAVIFLFSLSFHNHGFADLTSSSIDSHTSVTHSIEDCSACLLQGNLQVPKTGFSINPNNFGQLIAYRSIDHSIPHTFVDLSKPSRAPPTV